MIQEAMLVPPRLRGLAPARWVGERGRPVPTTAFIGSPAGIPDGRRPVGRRLLRPPDQTSAWRNYHAVSLRVRGLGRAARAPTPRYAPRSARPRDPRVAVTLAAGRVTLQRVGQSGSVPIASTVVRPALRPPARRHRRRRYGRISVDGRIALRHTVRWSTRGGIGLGAWRARLASPSPSSPTSWWPGITGHRPDTPHAPQEESS